MVVTIWKDNWGRTKEFLESFNKKRLQGLCLTLKPLDNSYLTQV